MSFGPHTPTPRTCPRCQAAIPLSSMERCPVCKADLAAPGSPGEALVEKLTGVLGDLTGDRKPPKP